MIVKYHMIFVENLAESFNENFDESFISFCFNLVIKNHYNDADQNSCCVAESYFFF